MKTKIILILLAMTILPNFLTAQQKDTVNIQSVIKNYVNQFDSTKLSPTNAGYQYWFVDKKTGNGKTLKLSVVKPGAATHPPHKHAEPEIFYILEGTAMLYLNGDSAVAKPNSSFYCPPMSMHGLRNAGKSTLKYLVIKDY